MHAHVGRPRPPRTARLVRNMLHSGPPSVACMAGVVDYTAIAYGGIIPLRGSKGCLLLFVPWCGSVHISQWTWPVPGLCLPGWPEGLTCHSRRADSPLYFNC